MTKGDTIPINVMGRSASLSSAAVMLALREHVSKYKDPKEAEEHKEELKIHRTHFEEAMKKIRPLSMQRY